MAGTPAPISRRSLLALPLVAWAGEAWAARGKVVTLLGDSITAGFGLPARDALPAQLHLALERMGVDNVVRAAGVSGDTTAGGVARMDFSVQPDTAVVVVELGANDLLHGVDPRITRANLARILDRLAIRRMSVVLTGIRAPDELGRGYARDYNAIFPDLARTHRVALLADLLGPVARNPALTQGDGLHPNAQGARLVAERLAPVVAEVLAARASRFQEDPRRSPAAGR
jgi:acyl-CoA thioesterase-1